MKKCRIFSLALLIIMMMPMFAATVSADAAWAVFEPFESVSEAVPSGNLLADTSFDSDSCLVRWNPNRQSIDHISTSSGGYLRMYDIPNPSIAFDYTPAVTIPAGTYKFTGYFRMAYEGEVTELRFFLYDADTTHGEKTSGAASCWIYPTHDEWLKVEFYVVFDNNFTGFKIAGGPYTEFIQSYCIDNFSLVKVPGGLPAGETVPTLDGTNNIFGTKIDRWDAEASNNGSKDSYRPINPEREAEYEVQGIVMNRDIDFIASCSERGDKLTEQDFIDYVYQYEDTHVTDFMLNIFCQMAMYPSAVATDFLEQYDYYTANNMTDNITTNQEMANLIFRQKGIDFIKIFSESFKEIGIDFWLSYRMNDSHNIQTPANVTCWDFFTANPQYRRVGSRFTGAYPLSYYNNSLDYTHSGVREHILKVINESLSLYDCAGIELDFQRDIYIWHPGGEYAGLDILTEFMREVNRIVSYYETVRGHDIKVAIRCASDIQTNYDLGFDVITYAAEGLIDLVNPTSRWATTDFDIPVNMWAALMHPYGVEVAPGVEALVQPHSGGPRDNSHTLDSMAGAAANWYSQGADKFYMYNLFLGLNHTFPKENRITTVQNNLMIGSGAGHFNMLTTIGSYEKLMNRNREIYVTYNDIYAPWKTTDDVLPLNLSAGQTGAFSVSTGHIPVGAEMFLIIPANESAIADKCLQLTNRGSFWSGVKVTTDYQVKTTKTYQIKVDVKSLTPDVGRVRPIGKDGNVVDSNLGIYPGLKYNSGTPVTGADGWYSFTFDYEPKVDHAFSLELCGGINSAEEITTADVFFDNFVLLEDGVPVVTYDFNDDSQFDDWAHTTGAGGSGATGTVVKYTRDDALVNSPSVYVNGYPAEFVDAEYKATGITTGKLLTFRVPECVYGHERLIVEVTHTKALTVDCAIVHINRPIE